MRKYLWLCFSVLLALVLVVCSSAAVVFADDGGENGPGYGPVPADAPTIVPGSIVDVTSVSNDDIATFVFTPEEDGDYFFESLGDMDTRGVVFTATERIGSNLDGDIDENFIVYFHATAGTTYYLQSCLEYDDSGLYQVRLGEGTKPIGFVNITGDPVVIPGVYDQNGDDDSNVVYFNGAAMNEVFSFRFTPDSDDFYAFTYFNDEDGYDDDEEYEETLYDLCVFTEDGLIQMVDGSYDNMSVRFYGKAGETYFFQMRAQAPGGKFGAYVFRSENNASGMGRVTFCGQEIVDYDNNVSSNLPAGVAVDLKSNTITLTDCNVDVTGVSDCSEYISSEGSLNIVLNGTNTFTGLSYNGYALGTGIRTEGKLSIKGSGSLSMSMEHSFGIQAQHSIEIDGPSVTITGLPSDDPSAFYGMTIQPWESMSEYPNASGQYYIKINNAKVHISNTAAGAALNMGIDSQDSDCLISNSEVFLDLNGGETWGIGTGLYRGWDGRAYGGNLSIDDKSRVKITLTGTHEKYIDDDPADDALYALYFYENNINSEYIYASEYGQPAKRIQKTDVWSNPIMDGRLEAHYSMMDFSPTEQPYGNSGHVMEFHAKVTPTCTTGGNSEYWYCTDCKKYFSDAEGNTEIAKDSWVLAAVGHNPVHFDGQAPTETARGWKEGWYCNRCDKRYADAECEKAFYNDYSVYIPETSHEHDMEHRDAKPATSTSSGNLEHYYCSDCRKYFSDEAGEHEYEFGEWIIPPQGDEPQHDHSMTKTDAVAATCTTAGNSEYYYCSGCKKYFSDEACENEIAKDSWIIKALGHNTEKHAAVAATCTTAGNSEYYYCSGCKKYFSDEACENEIAKDSWIIEALGHSIEKHAAVEPTATEPGNSEYYYCTTCEKYFSDEACENEIEKDSWIIPATGEPQHEHSPEKHAAVAATCTTAGNSEYYYCSGCKKYFSDEACENEIAKDSWIIKALGHNTEKHAAVEPTATEPGNSEYYYCSACEKYFSDEACENEIEKDSWIIPATGEPQHEHNMIPYPAFEATCYYEGNSAYWYCIDCEKYFSDADGKHEIKEGDWNTGFAPHTLVKVEAQAATAYEEGNTEYFYCSECWRYFSDEGCEHELEYGDWVIPATGEDPGDDTCEHDFVYVDAKAATCTENGNTAYCYCSKCMRYFTTDESHEEIWMYDWLIEAQGHTEVTDIAYPATCFTSGRTQGSHCSVCGEVLKAQNVIPPTGRHIWDSGEVEWAPTVWESGEIVYTCYLCGEEKYTYPKKLKPTIKLSAKKKTIKRKKSYTLTISKLARGDSVKSVKSSKKKVATVKKLKKNKYKITGKKKGKAVITVTLESGKKAKCTIIVK